MRYVSLNEIDHAAVYPPSREAGNAPGNMHASPDVFEGFVNEQIKSHHTAHRFLARQARIGWDTR